MQNLLRIPEPEACCQLAKCVFRTGGRVVERARLESVCTSNSTVGSNPTLSATAVKQVTMNTSGLEQFIPAPPKGSATTAAAAR
jgi:hypothetical protein